MSHNSSNHAIGGATGAIILLDWDFLLDVNEADEGDDVADEFHFEFIYSALAQWVIARDTKTAVKAERVCLVGL